MPGGGGGQKGLAHNLLMQFFTLGSSNIEVFDTYFSNVAISQNDHPSYVKHILGHIYMFLTLFGYWVPRRGSNGIGAQPAYAVFQPI